MEQSFEKITVSNTKDVEDLAHRFCSGERFTGAFIFQDDDLFSHFLSEVGIDYSIIQKNHYYFDNKTKIHISECLEEDYIWISTMGLVARAKTTGNKFLNAWYYQKIVLVHLLEDVIQLCSDESTYLVGSWNYSMVEQLTPAIFHQTIFYYETLAKAYLSINNKSIPHTHTLKSLLKSVKETMFEKNHNNSLFHAYVIPTFEEIVRHIDSIPGRFNEAYVKYDDNPQDTTLVAFDADLFQDFYNVIAVTDDIISDLYYNPEKCHYAKTGLYEKMINNCKTEQDRIRIEKVYHFLKDKK